MLSLISDIVSWIVTEINHIISFISQIPTYVNYFVGFVNHYIPDFMLPYILLAITITVIIHIKRLVF